MKSIRDRQFIWKDMEFHAPQGGLYTMYNCMAVLCVADFFHIDMQYAAKTFETMDVLMAVMKNLTLMVKNVY